MLKLESTSFEAIRSLRTEYLKTAATPLDGMWEDAFFAQGRHWWIRHEGETLGYVGLNEDNVLLGFQCLDPTLAEEAFGYCLAALGIRNAMASTAEPGYLSLCLDRQSGVSVNARMYGDKGDPVTGAALPEDCVYRLALQTDFPAAVAFGVRAIGADVGWLRAYYQERISQEELFTLWRGEQLMGAGELRISSSQPGVADVGMVIDPDHRRKGLAALVLKQLLQEGRRRGLRVICSTEQDNLPAQKAIVAAGFVSDHRILAIEFRGNGG